MSLSLILSWIYLFGPLVLAGLAVWTRINKRHPNTAGYVSNATKFTTWLFFLAIIGFILLLIWNGPHRAGRRYSSRWHPERYLSIQRGRQSPSNTCRRGPTLCRRHRHA